MNIIIKTNDDDWYEIFYNGECLYTGHRPPDNAYQLSNFLNALPGIVAQVEITEFD